MRRVIKIDGYKCICLNDAITIVNSYDIKNPEEFIGKLIKELDGDFNYKRTRESWIKELYVHNLLYKYGLFKSHTRSTDLCEDESLYRLIAYNILMPIAKIILK